MNLADGIQQQQYITVGVGVGLGYVVNTSHSAGLFEEILCLEYIIVRDSVLDIQC